MIWSSQEFFHAYSSPGFKREAAIVREILKGNFPSFCAESAMLYCGNTIAKVMPDYFSIGTDQDFVRCPMTPYAAQYVAKQFGYKLPTPKLVDLIYKNAAIKVDPKPMSWNYNDNTGTYGFRFYDHNKIIQAQLLNYPDRFMLLDGCKKDIVCANLWTGGKWINAHPHCVCIYGWEEKNGTIIQKLFTKHSWDYSDYSHGVRFVKCDDPTLAGPCSLDDPPEEFLKLLQAA